MTHFGTVLIRKLVLRPYQYYYICGKRTVSAFQRYKGLGVCDSFIIVKMHRAFIIGNFLHGCAKILIRRYAQIKHNFHRI